VDDLVRRAQRGDTIAMNRLLDALLPRLGRLCGAIALDDGPDALQDAAILILGGLRGLREPAALWGWARTIATREAVRYASRRGRPAAESLSPVDGDGIGRSREPAIDDATATRLEIREQLARLSVEQRAILYLRDLEGLEESEVAAILGVAVGTVKSRLHRARAAFRKEWEA
jgi:RNA polymerase sigma factor (sigma-70 family)